MPLCQLHLKGVPPEATPFYYPRCDVCEAKALAGKVSRDAGPYDHHIDRWTKSRRRRADAARIAAIRQRAEAKGDQ